jgi:hypothetical protein
MDVMAEIPFSKQFITFSPFICIHSSMKCAVAKFDLINCTYQYIPRMITLTCITLFIQMYFFPLSHIYLFFLCLFLEKYFCLHANYSFIRVSPT